MINRTQSRKHTSPLYLNLIKLNIYLLIELAKNILLLILIITTTPSGEEKIISLQS